MEEKAAAAKKGDTGGGAFGGFGGFGAAPTNDKKAVSLCITVRGPNRETVEEIIKNIFCF